MDKRSLLDDVLTRFVPEKADQNLIRDRTLCYKAQPCTLGYNKRANAQCKRSRRAKAKDP